MAYAPLMRRTAPRAAQGIRTHFLLQPTLLTFIRRGAPDSRDLPKQPHPPCSQPLALHPAVSQKAAARLRGCGGVPKLRGWERAAVRRVKKTQKAVIYSRLNCKRLPKISSRVILLSSLSTACNYAFKMFNVCKCTGRSRWCTPWLGARGGESGGNYVVQSRTRLRSYCKRPRPPLRDARTTLKVTRRVYADKPGGF